MILFGHRITWAETKSFLKEATAVVGLAVTITQVDHVNGWPRAIIMTASATLLTVTHAVNVWTTSKVKIATATAPLASPPAAGQ